MKPRACAALLLFAPFAPAVANPVSGAEMELTLFEEHVTIEVGKEKGVVDGQFNFFCNREEPAFTRTISMPVFVPETAPQDFKPLKELTLIRMKPKNGASTTSLAKEPPKGGEELWHPANQRTAWFDCQISGALRDDSERMEWAELRVYGAITAKDVHEDEMSDKEKNDLLSWKIFGRPGKRKFLLMQISYEQRTYVENGRTYFAYVPIFPQKALFGENAKGEMAGEIQLTPEKGFSLALASDYPKENVKPCKEGFIIAPLDKKPIVVELRKAD